MPSTALHDPLATLRSLFGHKAWANEELFAALARVDADKHPAEARAALRILNHVHVVDSIFKAHLEGVAHGFSATNTAQTPTLAGLAAAVEATDAWFLAHVDGLPGAALQERIRFAFTDGEPGTMTREEMLLHVVTHGGYHRGAAGQLMQTASVAPPRDLYTRFLHLSEPSRRH